MKRNIIAFLILLLLVAGIAYSQSCSSTTICATTTSIGGGALLAGTCASGTASVTGSSTGNTVSVSPNTYPGDGIIWYGYVSSAGTVTVKVCSILALTPTSSTYNIRVIQ